MINQSTIATLRAMKPLKVSNITRTENWKGKVSIHLAKGVMAMLVIDKNNRTGLYYPGTNDYSY
jgi:hypothetical protein